MEGFPGAEPESKHNSGDEPGQSPEDWLEDPENMQNPDIGKQLNIKTDRASDGMWPKE